LTQIKPGARAYAMKVDVTYSLSHLFALCSAQASAGFLPGAGLLAMVSLGLLGSVVHCGAMCGPLVLGQVADRLACVPCSRMSERDRLSAGLLLPYHLGRISTYAALGAAAGAMGFGLASLLHPLRSVLLAAAACGLLLIAVRRRMPRLAGGAPSWLAPVTRRLRPGGVLFGASLGLLPCGLVYTALLAASATASLIWGAAFMAAFGAGTMPMLWAIGLAGNIKRFRQGLLRVAPAVLVFDAAVLLLAAVSGVFV
jgi:sulfite exporter TauE/SafE